MLVSHRIDDEHKVIITTFAPEEATLKLFMQAFANYQEELQFLPDYQEYHELVDFRPIIGINISAAELKEFSSITLKSDNRQSITKLALLVDSKPAYTLARVYQMLRNFSPGSKKQVKVFRDMDDAYEWLCQENDEQANRPA